MPNLNVAVLGVTGYSKSLGKKSTTSDITFYDLKQDETTVSIAEPSMYPEKLASLFYATSLADVAVVVVDQINPAFGESTIALDCLEVKQGYMILRNFIVKDQIAPLIKGTVLENYTYIEDDPVQLRQQLVARAENLSQTPAHADGRKGSVAVDHFFDVRGVGTVVLGCVAEGVIRRHDAVKALPQGTEAEIRSIQKHDDDFDSAVEGDRVGLALRGISVDDLERGTVLTTDESITERREITGRAHLVKYWLNPLKKGMVLHIGHWMQFEPARIEAINESDDWRNPTLKLSLQKGLVHRQGTTAIMTYLEGGKLRVVGTVDMQ
jgi:selenocysteine-specific translation elongation factor